ncbi:MAG: hypothetical protein M0033_01320 [Nitrospiraceae bacterium]|nr:hypothetical protein [Nitrospiraceae bacterium]
MRLKYLLPVFFVFMMAMPVFALTTISSLPYNRNIPGETYVLGANLSAAGTAITVSADNIVLDGQGHTLTYGTSQAGFGIDTGYTHISGLEIKNFNIVQGAYEPLTNEHAHAIRMVGSNVTGINIHNNTITLTHGGAYSGAFTYGVDIEDFTAPMTAVINSNIFNMTGTSAERGVNTGPNSGYMQAATVTVENNTFNMHGLLSSPAGYPTAIVAGLGGGNGAYNPNGVEIIHNNTINMDSNCDTAQGMGAGSDIAYNTINVSGAHSRGIVMDHAQYTKIYMNTIKMTCANAANDYSSGIRVRFAANKNEIFRNTIDASGCTGAGGCFPLRVGGADTYGDMNTPAYNSFHDNVISINASTASEAIRLEDGSANSTFYRNTINATGGYAIYVTNSGQNSQNNNYITDPTFSYENIRGGSIYVSSAIAGGISGLVFCNDGITGSDITGQTTGWSVTNPSCCAVAPLDPPSNTGAAKN